MCYDTRVHLELSRVYHVISIFFFKKLLGHTYFTISQEHNPFARLLLLHV